MAFINPELAQGGVGWLKSLQGDADFQKLSPESQQTLMKYISQAQGGSDGRQAFTEALQTDPALQSAMAEAKQNGALDHPMSALNKVLATGLGIAVGGAFILPALAGGGAAAAPGATTGAVPGLAAATPATAAIPASLAPAASSGILSTVGGIAKKFGSDILGEAGRGVGDATQAAGQNRINADRAQVDADRNYESALTNRASTEAGQRKNAEQDVYRAGWYENRQPGPNNTRGITPISDNYKTTLSGLEQQAMTQLANPARYDMSTVDPLKRFTPTPMSTGEKVGTYATPILSTLGRILKK